MSNAQSPTHLYANETVHNASLVVTTSNGCKDTTLVSFFQLPSPKPDFKVSNLCVDEVFNFGQPDQHPNPRRHSLLGVGF